MKILHTADWHLTACKSFIPDSVQRTLRSIDEIYRLAASRKISTIVVAGDIFDSPALSLEEKRLLADKILHYDELGFATLMIPGNHDKIDEQRTTLHELALFTQHERFKASVVTEKTRLVVIEHQAERGIRPNRFGFLLFTGEPWSFLADHIARIAEGSLELDLDGLIVVAHATCKGAITDTGYILEDGVTVEPNEHVLYHALGDIHAFQRMAPRTFYCGSPHQVNFGEIPPNGVLIVDTDDPDNPEFVEITGVSKLVTIENPDEPIPSNCYARLKYSERPKELPAELNNKIIRVQVPAAKIDTSDVNFKDDNLLSGLEQILAKRGLTPEEIVKAQQELTEAGIAIGGS